MNKQIYLTPRWRTQAGTTTQSQSRPGSNCDEGVRSRSFRTRMSPLDAV